MEARLNFDDYRRLDHALYEHFGETISTECEPKYNDYRWRLLLAADIESLSMKHGFNAVKEATQDIIGTNSLKIDHIDWESIENGVRVRNDWPAALRSVKEGRALSARIGWSFYEMDLLVLMRLHKANRFRRKIEGLLDDCNFHSLSSYLECKDYDAAAAWIDKEM